MTISTVLRASAAFGALVSLSACLGNGNGTLTGGPGGPGGGSTYQENLERVQNLGPQTVRQTGTINYTGKTRLDTFEAGQSAATGFLEADLAVAADFSGGTLSGTATNFAGEVNNTAVTLDGTLSTANTTDPNIVTQTDIVVPVVGGTVTTGALIGNMNGVLTDTATNQSATTQLVLTGSFVGTNAEGATGTAAGLVGDPNAVGFELGGGGTFYLDQQ